MMPSQFSLVYFDNASNIEIMREHTHLTTAADVAVEEAAQAFAALGSEPRLEALRLLVRAGPQGLTVGEIREVLDIPASTCTHHLRFLAAAGLVKQARKGRQIGCSADFERIEALAGFLIRECCDDAAANDREIAS